MQQSLFTPRREPQPLPASTEYQWIRVRIHNVDGEQTISVPRGTYRQMYDSLSREVSARFHVPERNIEAVTLIPRPIKELST